MSPSVRGYLDIRQIGVAGETLIHFVSGQLSSQLMGVVLGS